MVGTGLDDDGVDSSSALLVLVFRLELVLVLGSLLPTSSPTPWDTLGFRLLPFFGPGLPFFFFSSENSFPSGLDLPEPRLFSSTNLLSSMVGMPHSSFQ